MSCWARANSPCSEDRDCLMKASLCRKLNVKTRPRLLNMNDNWLYLVSRCFCQRFSKIAGQWVGSGYVRRRVNVGCCYDKTHGDLLVLRYEIQNRCELSILRINQSKVADCCNRFGCALQQNSCLLFVNQVLKNAENALEWASSMSAARWLCRSTCLAFSYPTSFLAGQQSSHQP